MSPADDASVDVSVVVMVMRVAVVGADLEGLRAGVRADDGLAVELGLRRRCGSISADSCWYSVSRLARSPVPLVPLADCTASSRMRCSASLTLASAPSAVCASEMPSLALRIATFMPRTWVFMRSAIARPAASSLAVLTRRPEDRRCIEVASDDCEVVRLRCAFSDARLVLMVWGMRALLKDPIRCRALRPATSGLVREVRPVKRILRHAARPRRSGEQAPRTGRPVRRRRARLAAKKRPPRWAAFARRAATERARRWSISAAATAPAAAAGWPARPSRCRPAAGSARATGWPFPPRSRRP